MKDLVINSLKKAEKDAGEFYARIDELFIRESKSVDHEMKEIYQKLLSSVFVNQHKKAYNQWWKTRTTAHEV